MLFHSSDLGNEGNLLTVRNEPAEYVRWASSEPDNRKELEHCGILVMGPTVSGATGFQISQAVELALQEERSKNGNLERTVQQLNNNQGEGISFAEE